VLPPRPLLPLVLLLLFPLLMMLLLLLLVLLLLHGPGIYCSPRHRMPFNSIITEGSKCVSGFGECRATAARLYLLLLLLLVVLASVGGGDAGGRKCESNTRPPPPPPPPRRHDTPAIATDAVEMECRGEMPFT
jgi:hypothetical protein